MLVLREGIRFGRWCVVAPATRRHYYLCKCDCGVTREVYKYALVNGASESCGCGARELLAARAKHGMTGTPAHRAWIGMRRRCYDKGSSQYNDYGARGIAVCARWREDFETFYEDMGDPPFGATLERENNDGNYEPGNCRWATRKEQANNRRSNRRITFAGRTRTMAEWAAEIGVSTSTLSQRLNGMDWSEARALTTPLRGTSARINAKTDK